MGSILNKLINKASALQTQQDDYFDANKSSTQNNNSATQQDDLENVNLDMILNASQKLIDINRGDAETDARDSLVFKKVLTPDKLLAERIGMDANKIRRNVLSKISRKKSLKSIPTNAFNKYVDQFITGNPLSIPSEEINPMQLAEQNRRVSQMGLGGLSSAEVITPEAQNVHVSEFGFLDNIQTAESEKVGIDTRLATGAKIGSDNKIYQKFYDRKNDKYVWLNPGQVADSTVAFPKQ